MKPTENVTAKGKMKISALKLKRETLRELDAGELEQAQGGGGWSRGCITTNGKKCTWFCGY